nr:putative late blight resistance protein homolog R1A-3 [Coffea arabica]
MAAAGWRAEAAASRAGEKAEELVVRRSCCVLDHDHSDTCTRFYSDNLHDEPRILVPKVRETLKYEYLIVMDDVWNTKAWEDLKDAFPDYSKGSRVLIITPQVSVAQRAATKTDPYPLRFMKQEKAEELLRTKIFNEMNVHRSCDLLNQEF